MNHLHCTIFFLIPSLYVVSRAVKALVVDWSCSSKPSPAFSRRPLRLTRVPSPPQHLKPMVKDLTARLPLFRFLLSLVLALLCVANFILCIALLDYQISKTRGGYNKPEIGRASCRERVS